jgi:dihydrofolate reductase
MPKHVASRTLTEASWNATIIEGDVAEAVARLKDEDGDGLLKFGTGQLDRTLLEHDLLDELHFWSFPVLAGSGRRLIGGIDVTHLELIDSTQFESGIVVNAYAPK